MGVLACLRAARGGGPESVITVRRIEVRELPATKGE
jgi:hypothetical protein